MEEVENNNGLKTLVFNIFQIESASVSNMGKVHICLADITKLPGTADRYSWPVEEAFLQELAADKVGTYIPNWLENNRLTTLANRYYFYNALKNREIELSWIYQQGEKRFSPSPYINVVGQIIRC